MRLIVLTVCIASLTILTIMRNGIWSDEVKMLEDIVKKSPGNARAWNNLGRYYSMMGYLDKAEDAIRKALMIIPEPIMFVNLGKLMAKKGRFDDAILLYEKALSLADDKDVLEVMRRDSKAFAYFELGNLYVEFKKDYSMAEYYYRKSLEINPDDGMTWCNLGYVLLMQNGCKEAMEALQNARRLMPEDDLTMENIELARECMR